MSFCNMLIQDCNWSVTIACCWSYGRSLFDDVAANYSWWPRILFRKFDMNIWTTACIGTRKHDFLIQLKHLLKGFVFICLAIKVYSLFYLPTYARFPTGCPANSTNCIHSSLKADSGYRIYISPNGSFSSQLSDAPNFQVIRSEWLSESLVITSSNYLFKIAPTAVNLTNTNELGAWTNHRLDSRCRLWKARQNCSQ